VSWWRYSDQERTVIRLAAERAHVDADDVADWWWKHRSWTLEQVVARFVNLRDQAERRAAHDTGYERGYWPFMIGKKAKP
jgi:hypothetical protein